MIRIKAVLTGSLITLLLCFAIFGIVLVMSDAQPVQAESADQPVVMTTVDNTYYLPLTDAPPQRNIAQQQFAPLAQ